MDSNVAPLHGKTALYTYVSSSEVMIMKKDYAFIVTSKKTFKELYHELDDRRAALKSDCIEYAVCQKDKPIECYPKWFLDAMEDGWIVNEYGTFTFLDHTGEFSMSPTSVILRNFMGDLKYMEPEDFIKYYDTLKGE